MDNERLRYIAHLKHKQKELDSDAATLASMYNLWSVLLPRVAYPPGRLTAAVVTALEDQLHDTNTVR